MNSPEKTVIALTADLIFAARIRAADTDAKVILAKDVQDFLRQSREHQPSMVLIDLDRRGLDVEQVVREVKAGTKAEILAYGSHVREDLFAAARSAGADRVLARGAFVKQLTQLLRSVE